METRTLWVIAVAIIIVFASVSAYAVVNFLNNNELIDVTSPIAKMWSKEEWDVVGQTYQFYGVDSDGDMMYHWVYQYDWVWHYYIKLKDGYTQDISSADYAKFNIGDSFTYQKWVPKDR
jgi:hypothetical protein